MLLTKVTASHGLTYFSLYQRKYDGDSIGTFDICISSDFDTQCKPSKAENIMPFTKYAQIENAILRTSVSYSLPEASTLIASCCHPTNF